jgi:hypothetical protein
MSFMQGEKDANVTGGGNEKISYSKQKGLQLLIKFSFFPLLG